MTRASAIVEVKKLGKGMPKQIMNGLHDYMVHVPLSMRELEPQTAYLKLKIRQAIKRISGLSRLEQRSQKKAADVA